MKKLAAILLVLGVVTGQSCKDNTAQVITTQPADSFHQQEFSEDQFERWRLKAFQPIIDRWLSGEDLNGKFIDIEWEEDAKLEVSMGGYQAKTKLLDADGDGSAELVFQTGCSPVGNCEFYIYSRQGSSFRRLLEADMVQTFKLRTSKTNGYFDLETTSHGSAVDGGMAIYRYDNSKYKITECFGFEYEQSGKSRNGRPVYNKEPTLKPADCAAWPESK